MNTNRREDLGGLEQVDGLDDELLRLIYEGPLERRPWRALLTALRKHLHCWHANVSFHRRTGPGAWFDSVVDCEGPLVVSVGSYVAKYAALDPIPYQSLVPGRPYLRYEIHGKDDAFYRECLHPQGIDDFIIMMIEESGGMRAWLTLARTSAQPAFTTQDCQLVRSLAQHFTTALRTFAALKTQELELGIYREALDTLALGTVLIDQSGHVVRADAAAARIFERNSGLAIVDKRLRASNRADDSALREAIVAGIRHSSSAAPAYSSAIRCSTCANLTLLVRSLAPSACSANEKAAAVVVYLSDSETESAVSTQYLIKLFGMSAMEAALTLQLVRGRTLAEAAHVLHLSEQTARTYSKHVFAKTGTHRQADLVRLILTSVAHLAGGSEEAGKLRS